MLEAKYAEFAKKNRPYYTDFYNHVVKLSSDEQSFFWETVAKVQLAVGVDIPVYMADHELLPRSSADALGIHWKNSDGDEFITIDCYFIHECYEVAFNGAYNIDGEDLVSVLCHELAHIKYQRHTKYHEALTEEYINIVNGANEG